jgi:hypothetical protein
VVNGGFVETQPGVREGTLAGMMARFGGFGWIKAGLRFV